MTDRRVFLFPSTIPPSSIRVNPYQNNLFPVSP